MCQVRKKVKKVKGENKAWQELRTTIYKILESMHGTVITSRAKFLEKLETELKKRDLKITKRTIKIVWQQIGERDEEAEICLDDDGKPEADNELKDYERVPYGVDIQEYFKKEVLPYASDAWIDEGIKDDKDKKIGIVGYEIPFAYYFYQILSVEPPSLVKKEISKISSSLPKLFEKLLNI